MNSLFMIYTKKESTKSNEYPRQGLHYMIKLSKIDFKLNASLLQKGENYK